MIINRLLAENLLKYRKLELTDLPARGLIAISGPNESGKTAIGETICFALFGRSFSLPATDLAKAVCWGEFRGSVALDFTGHDGGHYTVVREIDDDGNHTARLSRAGQKLPVAQGVPAVAAAVEEACGFSYERFIDSFYLAQREMEVPHVKSGTLKALIGVDKLEHAAEELAADNDAARATIAELQAEIDSHRRQITELQIDEGLESSLAARREEHLQAIAEREASIAELAQRQHALEQAIEAVDQATGNFLEANVQASYEDWSHRRQRVAECMLVATEAAKTAGGDVNATTLESVCTEVQALGAGLEEYQNVRSLADRHRQSLLRLFEPDGDPPPEALDDPDFSARHEPPFSERRAELVQRIERVAKKRRPRTVAGVAFSIVACVAWATWMLALTAPESSVARWLQQHASLGETASQVALLVSALAASWVALMMFVSYSAVGKRLRALQLEVADLDREAELAREEIQAVEASREAPLPSALDTLRGVRDHAVGRAVAAFIEGDGAVFVREGDLTRKIDTIRGFSDRAKGELRETREQIRSRTDALNGEIDDFREKAAALDAHLAEERRRRQDACELEHVVASLEQKIAEQVRRIGLRDFAGKLLDGTCRQIYARFQPELRRFVSKLLPQLTNDRYHHLQIDDELNVTVFSAEKNGFVGLQEISNGTHRQLMLCVRLALSQALIASSIRDAQFIFLDEPFVFFDEQRAKRAIDVLGKISPQITQVWVVAQAFDDASTFDLHIRCDDQSDSLTVSGNGSE